MNNCEHCNETLLIGADHWCRCTDCGSELQNNDYDDLCKRCYDAEWQMEQRAGVEEWNWRNDHGDCE